MGYINSIKLAMLVFPVLAFFITLPYMIINYRKYGSINKLRTLILYSFVLYVLPGNSAPARSRYRAYHLHTNA